MIEEETFNWETNVFRDKLGRQIEADELEILLRDSEYKIVEQTIIGDHLISTVWIGVPHNMGIYYFETMVFDKNKPEGEKIQDCIRYMNLVEAEAGHKDAVAEWIEKLKQ